MVTALWVLFDTIVVWWTSLLERKLTQLEKMVLLLIGLSVAIYGGYSEHADSNTQANIIATLEAIASKVGVSPNTTPAQLGTATIAQIDALKKRLANLENQRWPSLDSHALAGQLQTLGRFEVCVSADDSCSDCLDLKEAFLSAEKLVNWPVCGSDSGSISWQPRDGIWIYAYERDQDNARHIADVLENLNLKPKPRVEIRSNSDSPNGQGITLRVGVRRANARP
jgi:hypothetical protein